MRKTASLREVQIGRRRRRASSREEGDSAKNRPVAAATAGLAPVGLRARNIGAGCTN